MPCKLPGYCRNTRSAAQTRREIIPRCYRRLPALLGPGHFRRQCPRSDARMDETPSRAGGIRSISALVDITNYVMLEQGNRSTHATTTPSSRVPSMRAWRVSEEIQLLNEQTLKLQEDVLLSSPTTSVRWPWPESWVAKIRASLLRHRKCSSSPLLRAQGHRRPCPSLWLWLGRLTPL